MQSVFFLVQTMQLCDNLNLNSVYIDKISQSKTAVLLKVSQLLSQDHPKLNVEELFEAYWKRECLGSTAIGQGITIPHIRSNLIKKPRACFIRLQNPVDFGAEDKQPVDLVIGLVVPQEQVEQHLKMLSAIIKQFSASAFREACRHASNQEELYEILSLGALQEA